MARTVSSLSRAVAVPQNKPNCAPSPASTGNTNSTNAHDTSEGSTMYHREIEETVLSKMISANALGSAATSSTAINRQTVVPSPQSADPSSSASKPVDYHKSSRSEKSPIIIDTRLDQGIFESRTQTEDWFKRSAFDRIISAQLNQDLTLYGVIDGHGTSALCADYLSESFPLVVRLLLEGKSPRQGDESDLKQEFYVQVLREAFRICSREWDSSPQIRSNAHYRHCGAVALVALINHKQDLMYVANAGDCRCLVSQKTGRGWRFLHQAHRTENVHERLRVLHHGGKIKSVNGIFRVNGSLMPTRVFGDVELKVDFFGKHKTYLDPEPDLASISLDLKAKRYPNENENSEESKGLSHEKEDALLELAKEMSTQKEKRQKENFAIMATDGLWDGLTTDTVYEICTEGMLKGHQANDVAQQLGMAAMQATDDDVSIIVLLW